MEGVRGEGGPDKADTERSRQEWTPRRKGTEPEKVPGNARNPGAEEVETGKERPREAAA